MSRLEIRQESDWLGTTENAEAATFGELVIAAGEPSVTLTEVDDTIAKTTRKAIRVPMVLVAEWLVLHWWRLRWEPRPERPGLSWREAHSMASIGRGIPWPPLEIWSDGESVQLALSAELSPDVAAIRYIHNVPGLEVPARTFEQCVDQFLDTVVARLHAAVPQHKTLSELREELANERADQTNAQQCRWQACAGIDPGDAPDGWLVEVGRLAKTTGSRALEEALASAIVPRRVRALVDALEASTQHADVSESKKFAGAAHGQEEAWKRGAAAARLARKSIFGLTDGPLRSDVLGQALGLKLPISATGAADGELAGALRDQGGDVTRLVVRSAREVSQRFYLARVLGLAGWFGPDEHLLSVSDTGTAAQRFGRSFAQELLCPWAELDAFTDEHGTHEEALLSAADRYQVSEMLVTTTLVNRGKIDRARLSRFVD